MSCDLYHTTYGGSLVVEGYTESDHLPVVLTFTRKESVREDRRCQEETADIKYTGKKSFGVVKKNKNLWTT